MELEGIYIFQLVSVIWVISASAFLMGMFSYKMVYQKDPRFSRPIDVIILANAITDIIWGFSVLAGLVASNLGKIDASDGFCAVNYPLWFFSGLSSMWMLSLMAYIRQKMILKSKRFDSQGAVRLVLIFCLPAVINPIISLSFGKPPAAVGPFCIYIRNDAPTPLFRWWGLISQFFAMLPIVLAAWWYCKIYVYLRRLRNSNTSESVALAERRLLRLSVTMVVVYCGTIGMFFAVINYLGRTPDAPDPKQTFIYGMVTANTWFVLAPIIYFSMLPDYRQFLYSAFSSLIPSTVSSMVYTRSRRITRTRSSKNRTTRTDADRNSKTEVLVSAVEFNVDNKDISTDVISTPGVTESYGTC